MESHALHRDLVASLAVALALLAPRAASAQFELTGSWSAIATEDVSNDSVPVDYMGLPLTEDARAKALSYSESVLGMVDHQCEGWPPPYLATGPFGLKITRDAEPIKGTTVSYTIEGWSDRPTTVIWMDGRPHPSKYAPHLRAGFTTGKWDGNSLVTTTTHMKAGNLRKTGPPMSDQAVMTQHYFRHRDILTVLTIVEDPVYLAEPVVWSKSYQLAEAEMAPGVLACITTFEGTTPGEVPSWAPGKNPYVNEMKEKYGVPQDAILGYPETLYPEYRQKMKATPSR